MVCIRDSTLTRVMFARPCDQRSLPTGNPRNDETESGCLRNSVRQPSGCASFPKRNLLKYLQDPKGLVEGIPLVAGRMRKDLVGSVEHSSTCVRDSLRQARIVRLKNGRLIKLFPFVGTRWYYIQQIHNELLARKR
jgi:hypothetical protein